MEKKRWHFWVSGKVQGVFYRAHTQAKARELGLTGWVRNLPDGRVEILAEGEEEKLKALKEWCHEGPPLAVVTDVEVVEEAYRGDLEDFQIRY